MHQRNSAVAIAEAVGISGSSDSQAAAGIDHCIASYDSCSIGRAVSGEYLVRHGAFPGQRWVAANLPTAHARCTELIMRYGGR